MNSIGVGGGNRGSDAEGDQRAGGGERRVAKKITSREQRARIACIGDRRL